MINGEDIEAFEELFGYWGADYGTKARVSVMTNQAMVKEFASKSEQTPDPTLYFNLVVEEYDEVIKARTGIDELKELADLVYVIYGYANSRGYDLDEAIRRVHINNMGRMLQPDGTIKRREDGKIIKNPDYPKVKLDDLV